MQLFNTTNIAGRMTLLSLTLLVLIASTPSVTGVNAKPMQRIRDTLSSLVSRLTKSPVGQETLEASIPAGSEDAVPTNPDQADKVLKPADPFGVDTGTESSHAHERAGDSNTSKSAPLTRPPYRALTKNRMKEGVMPACKQCVDDTFMSLPRPKWTEGKDLFVEFKAMVDALNESAQSKAKLTETQRVVFEALREKIHQSLMKLNWTSMSRRFNDLFVQLERVYEDPQPGNPEFDEFLHEAVMPDLSALHETLEAADWTAKDGEFKRMPFLADNKDRFVNSCQEKCDSDFQGQDMQFLFDISSVDTAKDQMGTVAVELALRGLYPALRLFFNTERGILTGRPDFRSHDELDVLKPLIHLVENGGDHDAHLKEELLCFFKQLKEEDVVFNEYSVYVDNAFIRFFFNEYPTLAHPMWLCLPFFSKVCTKHMVTLVSAQLNPGSLPPYEAMRIKDASGKAVRVSGTALSKIELVELVQAAFASQNPEWQTLVDKKKLHIGHLVNTSYYTYDSLGVFPVPLPDYSQLPEFEEIQTTVGKVKVKLSEYPIHPLRMLIKYYGDDAAQKLYDAAFSSQNGDRMLIVVAGQSDRGPEFMKHVFADQITKINSDTRYDFKEVLWASLFLCTEQNFMVLSELLKSQYLEWNEKTKKDFLNFLNNAIEGNYSHWWSAYEKLFEDQYNRRKHKLFVDFPELKAMVEASEKKAGIIA